MKDLSKILQYEDSLAAMYIAIYGMPTNNPRKRVFIDIQERNMDEHPSLSLVRILKILANSKQKLTLDSWMAVYKVMRNNYEIVKETEFEKLEMLGYSKKEINKKLSYVLEGMPRVQFCEEESVEYETYPSLKRKSIVVNMNDFTTVS